MLFSPFIHGHPHFLALQGCFQANGYIACDNLKAEIEVFDDLRSLT
jgi:hypothetical protein